MSLNFLLLACISRPPEDLGTSGEGDSATDTGEGDSSGGPDTDTAASDAVDECGWESLSDDSSARKVAEGTLDGFTGPYEEISTFVDSSSLESWWSSIGATSELGTIDFSVEIALGVVTLYGTSSREGSVPTGVRLLSESEKVLGIRLDIPCDVSDDRLPIAQVWALAPGSVTVCRYGSRCE